MQPEIIYKSVRHGYARITKEGTVQLTVPSRLRGNQKFLDELLQKGQQLMLRYQTKNHLTTSDETMILLFGEEVPREEISPNPKKLPATLKEILYDYAKPLLDHRSQQLKIPYQSLTIRKTKSKWGSCTHDQRIFLNLDMIHLPTRLTGYVIIHEACHLKIKNHSPKFRELVENYCPNYKLLRKELKSYIIH